ncbi:hypothetical protein RJT34_32511 [Clitoria ternatea]|uniref:Auxin-induced protein n=1 Tax=Clitoria ternatea TaxID=43366 RepID=A0AAN9EYM6_CLITE
MELQLGLALPTTPSTLNSRFNHKKRTFSQHLDHAPQLTLSLLPLTPSLSSTNTINNKDDEDGVEALVGWPPLNYWRKKLRIDEVADNSDDHMLWIDNHRDVGVRGSRNTLYVKVKMEGVGIARKVDLCMHQSFQALKQTLMDMFGKCHQLSNSYELAYQDKEGDWLLAKDVPWRQVIDEYFYITIQLIKLVHYNKDFACRCLVSILLSMLTVALALIKFIG